MADEARMLELYNQGLTDPVIAGTMNINPGTVWTWRNKAKLPSNSKIKPRKNVEAETVATEEPSMDPAETAPCAQETAEPTKEPTFVSIECNEPGPEQAAEMLQETKEMFEKTYSKGGPPEEQQFYLASMTIDILRMIWRTIGKVESE